MELNEIVDSLNLDDYYDDEYYPELRKLYEIKKKILFICLERCLKVNPQYDKMEIFQIFYNAIGFENMLEANKYFVRMDGKLDNDLIDMLVYLMLNNKLNYSSLELIHTKNDIINYRERCVDLADDLYNEVRNNKRFGWDLTKYDDEHSDIKYNDYVSYLKFLIFLKKYGVGYTFVKDFYYAFASDLKNVFIDKEVINLFNDIEEIFNINDSNELEDIYNKLDCKSINLIDFFQIKKYLANIFSKIYLDSCYRPSEKEFLGKKKYNGKEILMYEAPNDFFMLVHVLGGFFGKKISLENGYLNDWESRRDDYISTSGIGTFSLNTCEINDVCYGFYGFPYDSLIASSISNLGIYQNFDNTSRFYPYCSTSLFGKIRGLDRYQLPKTFQKETEKRINNDLNPHFKENEIAYKRFNNGKIIYPDYIVFFKDDDESFNSELFQKSLKAASEFSIPIVIVERMKILEYRSSIENELNRKK